MRYALLVLIVLIALASAGCIRGRVTPPAPPVPPKPSPSALSEKVSEAVAEYLEADASVFDGLASDTPKTLTEAGGISLKKMTENRDRFRERMRSIMRVALTEEDLSGPARDSAVATFRQVAEGFRGAKK